MEEGGYKIGSEEARGIKDKHTSGVMRSLSGPVLQQQVYIHTSRDEFQCHSMYVYVSS